MIYADNAATTKLNREAFEAMTPFLLDNYANASQPYSFARKVKKALKESRKIIAESIHAAHLHMVKRRETKFAYIFVAEKVL